MSAAFFLDSKRSSSIHFKQHCIHNSICEMTCSLRSHRISSIGKPHFLKLSFDFPILACSLAISIQAKVVPDQAADNCVAVISCPVALYSSSIVPGRSVVASY